MSHAVVLAPAEAEPVVAPSVPTFEELTFRRFVSRRGGEPAADAAYHEARRRFEDEHGRIVLEWWSMSTASGAAVTVPQTSLLKSAVAS